MTPPPTPPPSRRHKVKRDQQTGKIVRRRKRHKRAPISIPRLMLRLLRTPVMRWGLRFAAVALVAVVVVAASRGVFTVVHHTATRTMNLCVVTDFEYRQLKPDWETGIKPLFDHVNSIYKKAGVEWQMTYGGDAYAPGTKGSIGERLSRMVEPEGCENPDIVLGFSGQPDRLGALTIPFSHTALVGDTAQAPEWMTADIVARTLAEMFGVPPNHRPIDRQAPDAEVLDKASVQLISDLRGYDFAEGVSALSGSWGKRAAKALSQAFTGRAAHPEAEAHRVLGRALAGANKYIDGARELREAAAADPQNSGLRFELAMALAADAENDKAIAELKTAARLEPAAAWPYAAMGAVYMNSGQAEPAAEEFRTATNIEPRNRSYQAALREALSRKPLPGRGVAAFEAALKQKPLATGTYSAMLQQIDAARRAQEAIRAAQTAMAGKPKSGDAHLTVAWAFLQAGDFESARNEAHRAVELEPWNGTAHLALAGTDFQTGRIIEAGAELGEAKAKGVTPPAALEQALARINAKPRR